MNMEIVDTAQQVAQQAQHITGLTAEAVTLLKAFFMVSFVVTAGVIIALVKTKNTWLPVLRGLARDHRESDPKLGNGSIRDDINKAISASVAPVQDSVNRLSLEVIGVGGALVKSNTALHDRLDAVVKRLDQNDGAHTTLSQAFVKHVEDGQPFMDSLKELIQEHEARKALSKLEDEQKRALGRQSTPEERAAFLARCAKEAEENAP